VKGGKAETTSTSFKRPTQNLFLQNPGIHMSSKQLRISDSSQIRQRIHEFVNKPINLVLKNNTVLFGELKRVDGEKITIRNMRLKQMSMPLSDIVEFYVDTIA
jgi:hypothetical protein